MMLQARLPQLTSSPREERLGFVDYAAYGTVSVMRFGFDVMSGYKGQKKLDTFDEKAVLTRYIILEEWRSKLQSI